jgi:mannose-6-phosphate isomerase-like protein (cupin superfamily)
VSRHRSFDPVVLLRGGDSAGAVSIIENRVPPRWEGPPLHHHDFDEAFYVLAGELTFQLGDRLFTAEAGRFAFARGGVHHTLANRGDEEARYVLVCTPAGFERYFDRVAAETAGVDPPPSALEPTPEVTRVGPAIGEREDLGPPTPLAAVPGRVRVLLRSADSAGRIAAMDNAIPAGAKGPPLHHHDFDEAFYVLAGELTFRLGDELVTRKAGELAFAPRGVHQAFANPGESEARTLLICTPAGFERYFQRMAARQAGVEPPPEALEPWPEVTTVGPRIGEEG